MAEGWWGPTFLVPGEPQARMLIIEKNLPGAIIVNKLGQRFVFLLDPDRALDVQEMASLCGSAQEVGMAAPAW